MAWCCITKGCARALTGGEGGKRVEGWAENTTRRGHLLLLPREATCRHLGLERLSGSRGILGLIVAGQIGCVVYYFRSGSAAPGKGMSQPASVRQ